MAKAVQVVNLDKVLKHLDRLALVVGSPQSQKQFTRTAQDIKSGVEARTEEGIGPEGEKWSGPGKGKGYSAAYKKVRERYQLETRWVDLHWTGQMFAAMTEEAKPERVRVFFTADVPRDPRKRKTKQKRKKKGKKGRRITNAAKAFYNHRLRPFFSLSDQQQERIVQEWREFIEKILKKKDGGSK